MPTVLRFIEDGSEHSVNLSILLMIASGLLIIVHVQQIIGGK